MHNPILDLAWLIPVFPLTAFVLIVFFLNRQKRLSGYVAVAGMLMALALSLAVLYDQLLVSTPDPERPFQRVIWPFIPLGDHMLEFGYLVDPLAAVMLLVVTLVGSCIFVYSQGYMADDPLYARFFAYMSLFGASMLTLVLANNLVLLYIAWELVGLCSYLLIGFYFQRPSAANAAKKAFITTRVGDVSLFIGLLILWTQIGTVEFVGMFEGVHDLAKSPAHQGLLVLSALLIFGGAVGKSAQFPLHVWLPDAMEGPTPVSALIHAATMVAAGVYLVGRTFPIFAAYAESQSLQVVAWIGAVTAIMAASIGIAMNQAKRILAYSTISQLGYMMAGLGVGGVAVGIFHLMTHAFFKALLFLGAGSAMHGTHEHADLDIWKAGGLRTAMPITYWTFLAGTLALAGIVPFAGFWSKDGILAKAFENNRGIFIILLFGAFLTAFYMFRMIFVAFFGHPRVYGTPAHHDETSSHHDQDTHGHQSGPEHPVGIHESPAVMTVPLIILAVFSLVIGWVGIPFLGAPFERFVMGGTLGAELEAHPSDMTVEIILMALSTVVAVSGIGLAYILYGRQPVPSSAADPLRRLGPLYTVLEHKLYFDEIYGFLVVRPVLWLAHILASFDLGVVDELVNWTGRTTYLLSRINRWIDTFIVDGVVNGLGSVTAAGGRTLRYLQTGQIQNYILLVLMGITLLAAFYIYQFAR